MQSSRVGGSRTVLTRISSGADGPRPTWRCPGDTRASEEKVSMDPIDEDATPASSVTGARPTPVRNKRSWLMTAAVATGLAVGAAGLAGAATGGSSGSTTAPSATSGYG